MTDYGKLMTTIVNNLLFIGFSIAMIVVVYLIAFAFEKMLEKKYGIKFREKNLRTKRLVVIAMFSALSMVIMLFEVPLFFAPGFYKLDFSEIPALIGAFMFGPCAGIAIEAVKILLKIVVKGTSTAFVGDFANFMVGCFIVVPSSIIYFTNKSKKSAVIGLVVGGIMMTIVGALLNGFYLLPKFSELYGMPMSVLVGMGTKVNPYVTNVASLVALCVVPFNILKSVLDGIITVILYKYVSKLIKTTHDEAGIK